ncbi:MAG: FG-GAP-like repeat-containing protein [Bacteroidota bacterium]
MKQNRRPVFLFCLPMLVFCGHLSVSAQFVFQDSLTSIVLNDFHSGLVVGIADMNGDGRDDLVRLDRGYIPYYEYQTLGTIDFSTRILDAIGEESLWSLCLADINGDGIGDLLGGQNNKASLLRSEDNAYTSIDLNENNFFPQASNFVDINQDGHLDIFICNDIGINKIWGNDGSGNFSLQADWIDLATDPISDNSGNYGSVWTDFDNDGDTDVYITKCLLGGDDPTDPRQINMLFVNDGNGNYTEMAANYGLAIGWQSWTADFQDIDNDGDFDCFLTNHDVPCQLLENDGTGQFTDITSTSGIVVTMASIQGLMRDFDNDGFVDVLVTGSFHQLFRNNGDRSFTEISDQVFNDQPMESFAVGDLNHDGFLDLYASYAIPFNQPSEIDDILWMNQGNDHHYLGITLRSIQSGNQQAIGARVEIYGAWGIQVREIRAGDIYGFSNRLNAHFGLGTATAIDSLLVHWPSGSLDTYFDLAVDQYVTLIEGVCQAPKADFVPLDKTLFCPEEEVALSLNAPSGFNYSWSDQSIDQSLTINEAGLYQVTISDGSPCTGVSPVVQVKQIDEVFLPMLVSIDFSGTSGDLALLSVEAENPAWYDAPIGGNFLGNGLVFTTDPIIETTTFYVESQVIVDNVVQCRSERTPVQIIISSAPELPGITTLQQFPNPVADQLTIQLEAVESHQLSLQMYNALGLKVREQQWILYPGHNSFALSVTDLPAGVYHLLYSIDQQSTSRKIILR